MNNNKLNEIFSLYESNKYNEAQELNNEVLKENPENIYALRYASLLSSKIKQVKTNKIPKVKWKQLKCPHCLSKISITWLNETKQTKIKKWEYNNLDIKCPYCNTNFLLQKKTAKSIIWIKIWNIINYIWKKYRVTWYVEYKWKWVSREYAWRLEYLEWILLWEDNSYLYFSEWFSIDEWHKTYDFEFSQKYLPKWDINIHSFKEKNILKINSIYWENSKSFSVGENIEILDFWGYVLEKEQSWTQIEAWFYKWNTVSQSEALNIFGKEEPEIKIWLLETKSFRIFSKYATMWFMSSVFMWSEWYFISFSFLLWYIFIALFILLLMYLYNTRDKKLNLNSYDIKALNFPNIVLFLAIWTASTFFIFKPLFLAFEDRKSIKFDEIVKWDKYEILYSNTKKPEITKTTSYDYGGVKTYYEEKKWIKFSVLSEDDIKIINEIKTKEQTNNIKEIKEWKIYKVN